MQKLSQEEKEIRGTYEPSREGIEPVEYDEYERTPQAPDHWPLEAQQIWKDTCAQVKKAGYLQRPMVPTLMTYCFAVYQKQRAEKNLLQDGFVITKMGSEGQSYEVVSPWAQVQSDACKIIDKFGGKFGLSPLDAFKVPKLVKEQKMMTLLK